MIVATVIMMALANSCNSANTNINNNNSRRKHKYIKLSFASF